MTPQEAKQKAIIEAYGKYGFTPVEIEKYVDPDGCTGDLSIPAGEYDIFDDYRARPKSLQGIETNNGWTRIEPDGSNLPYETGKFWVLRQGNVVMVTFTKKYNAWITDAQYYYTTENLNITHYQPIIKPNVPIY